MDNLNERLPLVERRIATSTKLAYALGHVFNDLTAATWFSYTLIYLQRVASLGPVVAGALLLLGQVVDAIVTPIFGFLVDRYCKKKIWHLIGSIIAIPSFPVIFGGFTDSSSRFGMLLYIASIVMFQTGWAAVQISHLSMIPSLTDSLVARADLTAIRYSVQVGAAVTVFAVTWIFLPTNEESMVELDRQDAYKFRNIAMVLTVVGLAATVAFHVLLKARLLEPEGTCGKARGFHSIARSLDDSSNYHRATRIGITILWRVAMLYVASRLFITLATVYLPLYIEETEIGGKRALATVPLVSYVSSFAAALLFKYLSRCCGSKVCYFVGVTIGILAAIVTKFSGNQKTIVVYVVAVLIGAGSSVTMVTALSVTAEFIGSRTERSALVYSVVTFLDKIVTGVAVILIEKWRCDDRELCPDYNRNALSIVCASSMTLGLLALLSVSRCLK